MKFSLAGTTLIVVGVTLALWALSDDQLIGGGPGFGLFQSGVLGTGLLLVAAAVLLPGWSSTLLAITLSTLVSLAVGEMALRMLIGPKLASVYELDDELLYRLKPGAAREYTHLPVNGGSSYRYTINADGFRGAPLLSGDAVYRVMVLGDSFIHGENSTLENTFVKQLESQLASQLPGRLVEAVNAGVAGYGPDQTLLRLPKLLKEHRPDLAVVAIYSGNDYGDLVRNKLFKLDASGGLLRNKPVIGASIRHQAELADNELFLRRLVRRIRDGMAAGDTTMPDPAQRVQSALSQHQREFQEYVVDGDNTVRELRSDPYSADVALLPGSDSAQYKVELMHQILVEMKSRAEAEGVPLRIVIIPHPIDVNGGQHATGRIDIDRYPDYDPLRLTAHIEQMCLSEGLTCLNLMPVMQSGGAASLYLSGGDDHWNDDGQSLAAEHVADWLLATTPSIARGGTTALLDRVGRQPNSDSGADL